MRQTYKLEYRNGWGEYGIIEFRAYTLIDAQRIAKNYCTQNMIRVAWLVNESGKRYCI